MKKRIIAITGLKGAGKDEVAKILINYMGYKKIAFADLLKDVTAELYGWPREGLEGVTPKWRKWRETVDPKWGVSPRQVLQKLGTDLIRKQLQPNLWAQRLLDKIEKSKYTKFVITDCRFKNEIELLSNSSYEVHFWRIERGERPVWWEFAEKINRGKIFRKVIKSNHNYKVINDMLTNVHESERSWQGLDNPEFIIYNNGTLRELHNKVCNFVVKSFKVNKWKLIARRFFNIFTKHY